MPKPNAAPDKPEPQRWTDKTRDRVTSYCDEPRTIEEIATEIDVEPTLELREWLESLVFAGVLIRRKGKRFQKVSTRSVVGIYRRTHGHGKSGGYVVPRDREVNTIDIPPGLEEGAEDGDLVLATLKQSRQRGGNQRGRRKTDLTGRVLGVIDSRPTEAIGLLEYDHKGRTRVRLEGYNLPRYAYLAPHEAHHTKPGTVVEVRLFRKPDSRGRTRAELTGSVGHISDPAHDLDNLVALFGFPGDFDPDAVAEAEALPEHPDESEYKGRVDLRKLPIITIDPRDAEDHDDAISLEMLDDGMVRLGVHIADVSHYISPGSALDEDARFRATSVYLPGKLIPMLPDRLSAGLCSLHDSVDRLALSCFMVFDAEGAVIRREIVKSVVRVRRFLTYEEVLPVLEGEASTNDKVIDTLLVETRKLADKLQRRRLHRGALILDIPRPHVYVNEAGLVTGVEPEPHDIAHNLIEECMLVTNESVARFLLERGLPYIGRIHPAPSEEAIEDFAEFCDEMKIREPDWSKPGGLQEFLDSVKDRAGYQAIHFALLRSMTRATYHAAPELHFALATDKYVHFTSPIRRYPDTVTHQVLTEYIGIGGLLRWESRALGLDWADGSTGRPSRSNPPGKEIPDFDRWEFQMPHVAAHSTERSIRADRGELAADQIKVLRTMIPRIGEVMHGTVISFAGAGVIVQLDENMAEGVISFRDLSDGWVEMHKFWAHYETQSGMRQIMMGDRMEVEISAIDLGSRSMQLTPVGEHAPQTGWSSGRRDGHRGRRKKRR